MRSRYALALLGLLLVPSYAFSATGFSTTLSGLQEVPINASNGTGTAVVILNDAQTQFSYSVTFSGLTGTTTASHIHKAPVGTNGGVIFGFAPPLGVQAGAFNGVVNPTAAQVADLFAGLYYVNIHSNVFPGGEIRGQLVGDATPAKRGTWGRIKSMYR